MGIKSHRQMGIGFFAKIFLAVVALAALPGAAMAQFTDTFNAINPAWVPNRYPPAGFASVIFDGDSRLCLTIDQTGSAASRPSACGEQSQSSPKRYFTYSPRACWRHQFQFGTMPRFAGWNSARMRGSRKCAILPGSRSPASPRGRSR